MDHMSLGETVQVNSVAAAAHNYDVNLRNAGQFPTVIMRFRETAPIVFALCGSTSCSIKYLK